MQRPSGTAAVRLSLWTLVFASLAMALVQPVESGTFEAPEIADPRGDVESPAGPACVATPGAPPPGPGASACAGAPGFVDLAFGWVGNETATAIQFFIDSGNNANVYGSADYDFHFTVAGIEYIAGLHVNQAGQTGPPLPPLPGDGAITPTGVATAAAFVETVITITVPKTAIGNPATGTTMSSLFLTSHLDLFGEAELFTDRAPDGDAFGTDYTFTAGGVAPVDPNDTDGDGMNDTCEMQYFGDLTHNETEDADGDTLTNGQECALGTDPTKADSDGDGTNDNLDPAPTDPTIGGSSSTSSTGPTTPPPTTTSQTTTTSSTSRTTSVPAGDDDEVKNLSDAVEQLKSDPGYLGLSGGGFLAVLVLCIIALAVRWSL